MPSPDPIAEARALLARFHVRTAHEIQLELMAASLGAYVVYGETGSADARVVHSGDVACFCIAEAHRGTPRARFSIAHELAHFLLHRHVDGLERIHGGGKLDAEAYAIERHANRFASELVLPTDLLRSWTRIDRPTLTDVSNVAGVFSTSLSATMQKWAAITHAPCAFVESRRGAREASRRGAISEAKRSKTFEGEAVLRRALEPATGAYAILNGEAPYDRVVTREHREAWGALQLGRVVIEESLGLSEFGFVMTWLRHG